MAANPYIAPSGYASGHHFGQALNTRPDALMNMVNMLTKYYGAPAHTFDRQQLYADPSITADSLISKWGGAMDVAEAVVHRGAEQISLINLLLLPFKRCNSLRVQLPVKSISRPGMKQTAEHVLPHMITTSFQMIWTTLNRHAIGFTVGSEVLADSPEGEREYTDKMQVVCDSYRSAVEMAALEALVAQNTLDIMSVVTKPNRNTSQTYMDILYAQTSNYLGVVKPAVGLSMLLAGVEQVAQAMNITMDTIVMPPSARRIERSVNPVTRKLTIERTLGSHKIGSPGDKFEVEVNCYGIYNLLTHTPLYNQEQQRPEACPLSRTSATASYWPIEFEPADAAALNTTSVAATEAAKAHLQTFMLPIQIVNLETHSKHILTSSQLYEHLNAHFIADPDAAVAKTKQHSICQALTKPDATRLRPVIVRPFQFLATSSIIAAQSGGVVGHTYTHAEMMSFGNDPADGSHIVIGAAYFAAWVEQAAFVIVIADCVPSTILGGCGTKFMDGNKYDHLDIIEGKGGDLFMMMVPYSGDTSRPLALTLEACTSASEAKFQICNDKSAYYADHVTSGTVGFNHIAWRTINDTSDPNVKQAFTSLTGRVPQFAMPGTCWTQSPGGAFDVYRPNTGHLGPLDHPSNSRLLRGLLEIAFDPNEK